MMGRQRLEELARIAQSLSEDGHGEGELLSEVLDEVNRLRQKEWTPERLLDALDTMAAIYLSESALDHRHTLGGTSVLDLIEWAGQRARRARPQVAEDEPGSAQGATVIGPEGWKGKVT